MQIWPFFQFYFQAGIGTDATMHDHIKKLLDRCYATKDENTRFSPTNLVCIPFDSLLYICMQMSCNYPIWSCFSFNYMFPLVCFLKRTNTHLNSDLTRILCILSIYLDAGVALLNPLILCGKYSYHHGVIVIWCLKANFYISLM